MKVDEFSGSWYSNYGSGWGNDGFSTIDYFYWSGVTSVSATGSSATVIIDQGSTMLKAVFSGSDLNGNSADSLSGNVTSIELYYSMNGGSTYVPQVTFSELPAGTTIHSLSQYNLGAEQWSGNDTFVSSGLGSVINGGAGLNTTAYTANHHDYVIGTSGDQIHVTSGSGTDTLMNIQRLQFNDVKVAFDMGTTQAGGETALLMGACLGASSLTSQPAIAGGLLAFFDAGNTLATAAAALVSSGIAAQLAGGADDAHCVDWIGHNVLGSAFTTDIEQACLGYVAQHGQADFLATVAGFGLNVDLTGLANSGLEYN